MVLSESIDLGGFMTGPSTHIALKNAEPASWFDASGESEKYAIENSP
jgi:hypothetical protein